ncbi:MAG: DUF6928 family protein [Acidobacteriota bacterium]
MGAKRWMLVYSRRTPREVLEAKPQLDREASAALAKKLFPTERLEPISDSTLDFTGPPTYELIVGCFPGLSIIAAREFAIDYPSRLPSTFLGCGVGHTIYLHTVISVVDGFTFAIWKDGRLQRSLSVTSDGVLEDIGTRLPLEEPYWAGEHPVVDPDVDEEYPLPFHPLELGDAALLEFFGYQLEGSQDSSRVNPEAIPLLRFRRPKPWWRLW